MLSLVSSASVALALLVSNQATALSSNSSIPSTIESTNSATGQTVTITNGTIEGRYVKSFSQDQFLGIPYAQPPVGSLRFAHPQPINKTWDSPLKATDYGPICIAYPLTLPISPPTGNYTYSEDCLTINVVRPAGTTSTDRLPVLVWIYGGGFQEGGSGEAYYNISALLQNSVEAGNPLLIVSFNYRLRGWGFLGGDSVRAEGSLNSALHDQRLALHWIHENIAAFGGDASKVTIQGESAGAASVGFQLLAYGGRDDGLISAAVAQSGGPYHFTSYVTGAQQEEIYQSVLAATNCTSSHDSLACLRAAPFSALDGIFATLPFFPVIDGDFIQQASSIALARGHFLKVPLLIGTNTDEGKLFVSTGSNTSAEFRSYISSNPYFSTSNNETISRLLCAYPYPGSNSTHGQSDDTVPLPAPYGSQFHRTARFLGDMLFVAGRRYTAEIWAKHNVPVYTYRFDTIPADVDALTLGATHFQEVAFVFNNVNMRGLSKDPFAIVPEERRDSYLALSRLMTRMWTSFAATGEPNQHHVDGFNTTWPEYSTSRSNIVFDGSKTSLGYVEKDDWRGDALRLIIDSSLDFGR
ncbi:putative extracellular lipase [Cadophora sp. DSE1049]|nr:putative extracellular lipase [Cadophora sp. DSE1049]